MWWKRRKPVKRKKRMILNIKRINSENDGSSGILYTRNFACYTLELPWKNNEEDVSCIPAGMYFAYIDKNTIKGKLPVIRFKSVKGRSGILIHVGNTAGTVSDGFKSDVGGCILVGQRNGVIGEQKAVLESKGAMEELLQIVKDEGSFVVLIENVYEGVQNV